MTKQYSQQVFQRTYTADLIRQGEQESKLFFRLDEPSWKRVVDSLRGDHLSFLGMWVKGEDVHILFLENGFRPLGVRLRFSVNRYLGLSSVRPAASVYERIIYDLWGKEAMDAKELSPWLDQGHWSHTWPLSDRPTPNSFSAFSKENQQIAPFPPVNGAEVAVIDPISGKNTFPSLWRFLVLGEKILKSESLYGYTHRGIISSLYNKTMLQAMSLISRINALDSVAHQVAFSHAIEDIVQLVPNDTVLRRRVTLIEISRIAAYLWHLSFLFRQVPVPLIAVRCELARELLLRWSGRYYGHRWLMDCVSPGNVRKISDKSINQMPKRIKLLCLQAQNLSQQFSGLAEKLKNIGQLSTKQAVQYGIGGVIGRASKRDFDIRRYMPEYNLEWLAPPHFNNGDVLDRVRLRFQEIQNSFYMIEQILKQEAEIIDDQEAVEPTGFETLEGEGIGVCEGVQGDIWYYVKMKEGKIMDIFIRDPSVNQALVLPDVLKDQLIENQNLIRASFGVLALGADL